MIHDVSGPGVIKVFDKLQKQGIKHRQTMGFVLKFGLQRIILFLLQRKFLLKIL